MSSSYNYEKALSIDWNGQVFVLTVRNETPIGGINYLYSSDGVSWYSSSDLSNSQLLTQSNPYNVKWTGTNFAMIGNVANVGGNTVLRSGAAGAKFSALSTAGQDTNAPLYDLEANLEFPHTITFPRNTTLALGGAPADTTKIAYSLDAGITWTPSANSSAVFSVTANNAVWNGKIWVAVGQGGNTIATSVDGNTWIGRGAYIFTVAGQGIAWSPQQALWVAAGQGTNSLAYSADGVYWTGLGTAMLGSGADVQWNGTVWSAVGGPNATNKSISYSYDGKNWSNPTQSNLFDITGIKTAWNGYFWTAIGSSTPANNIYNIGTSVDGIFWFMQKNTNFSSNITNMFTNPTATNEILFTTYGQVPGAPTALTYVSNNTTSVSFSFTAPVGGVTPTSYTVSAVPLSGQTISQTFAYGGTTGTITGLTSATSYTISLYSNGSTGSSVASNSITTQTTLIPPTNLTFVSYTTSSINISFTPPPLSSGVTITSYNATAGPASGSTVIVTGISGAGTSASITGLVASTQYSITLTATNSYGTSASSTALVYQTSLSPPYNLLASMVDTSSVSLSFIAPTLGTNVTVTSYTATFVPTTGPNITVNNITSSPVAVNGLTFSMNYNITMVAINSYGTSAASATYNYTLTTLLVITGVASGSTGAGLIAGNVTNDVRSGTSTSNGINYNVYSFQPGTSILPPAATSSQATYTINYTCALATTIYVLAVGGGGSGNGYAGGGGGASGVVMTPVSLASGSGSININVGAGGAGYFASGGSQTFTYNNGSNTTVTFTGSTTGVYTATGGGYGGGSNPSIAAASGGSGGGCQSNQFAGTSVTAIGKNNLYNYANNGGNNISTGANSSGGGGGAGTVGLTANSNGANSGGSGGNGGTGIQCFLPGITNFAPSGIYYGSYYWGGGGGGMSYANTGGNGGLGGGGGGAGHTTGSVGGIGGSGITNGSSGTFNLGNRSIAGSGGANTGGGGGGTNYGTSGSGGSGIVIIAFPINASITNNQAAVLPSALVSSGQYNATLNNASFSIGAYNTIKGAFGCRLLNYNYFGPIMTLRHSLDTTGSNTQNFYSDICGNLGTGYLATGQSLSTWLSSNGANTTYAYVTKWYNQGMDVSFNSATQYTIGSQPIYDVSNGLINFGYIGGLGGSVVAPQTNCYFNLPNGAYPYGDSSYSYILRHGYVNNNSNFQAITAGGTVASSQYCGVGINMGGTSYDHIWYNNDFNGTAGKWSASSNNIVTFKYTSGALANSRVTYVNFATTGFSMSYPSATGTIRNQQPTTNYIGYTTNWLPYNGQLNFLHFFNTALSDADRAIVEATPYLYSVPPTITGITSTTISANSFTLSWTAVASVSYYILWINGSIFTTYNAPATTSGTITHSSTGPWQINLYAYNATNVLLASGYMTTTIVMASASVSINSGASTAANGANTVFTFASSGTFTPLTSGYASVLIVGGGGAGGAQACGGGGGAGGLVYFDASSRPMFLTAGTTYSVTVGAGGNNTTTGNGANGNNSVFNNITATGGGGGGQGGSSANNGGCGGGGGYISGSGPGGTGGKSTQNIYASYYVGGFNGGLGGGNYVGAGGGGAGGSGQPAITGSAGGNGGQGYSCNITGTSTFYGGGGGGSQYPSGTQGLGGSGIGGSGSASIATAQSGASNTGSGGGGAGGGTCVTSGAGGSGVVIISCPGIPAIAGLSASSVTATTFVLSWTTVTNAASYVLNINGTNYGTSYGVVTTTGTVTPGVSGPWTVTLSAYNSGSVLLAMSYLPTNSFNTISPINQLFYYTFDTSTINSSYTLSSTFTSFFHWRRS